MLSNSTFALVIDFIMLLYHVCRINYLALFCHLALLNNFFIIGLLVVIANIIFKLLIQLPSINNLN